MAAKVMKTLWDESASLADEGLYPHSILGDDYVTQDNDLLDEMRDKIEDADEEAPLPDKSIEIEDKTDCGCRERK